MMRLKFISIVCICLVSVLCDASYGKEIVKKEYRPDGSLLSEKISDDEKKYPWISKEYFPNGNVSSLYTQISDYDSDVIEYYENGNKYSKAIYRGEEFILLQDYYPTGTLSRELSKKDNGGKKIRLSRKAVPITRNSNGKLIEGEVNELSEIDRFEILYDEDGNILKNGVFKKYYTNGRIESETPYKDGKKHGLAKFYSEDGKLIKKVLYEKEEKERKERDSMWDL